MRTTTILPIISLNSVIQSMPNAMVPVYVQERSELDSEFPAETLDLTRKLPCYPAAGESAARSQISASSLNPPETYSACRQNI